MDYSLIADERRAFGIDNLDGWHEHPLGAPASHLPCDEPSPEAAVLRLKAASEQAKSLPEP